MFTRCRHILKTMKKVTAAKFELAFTRYRHNLKTVGNSTVKTRCRTLMLKKSTYTLRIDQSRSKSVEKCSVYIIIECSPDAVSYLDRLGFRFQNLPFSKSAGKKCAVFVLTGGLSVTFFTVFKMCRHRVNAVLMSDSPERAFSQNQMTRICMINCQFLYPIFRVFNKQFTIYRGK